MRLPKPGRMILIVLALGALGPDRSAAATLFVDAAAAPGGNGTAGAPFQTIQDGVDAAAAGDVVSVAGGTYATSSSRLVGSVLRTAVVFMKDGVTVQGTGAGLTVIDGSSANTGVIFDGLAVATIDGVTVQNGYFRGTSSSFEGGGGILSYASSPVITNATITGNRAVPYGGGILITGGGNASLDSVVLTANQGYDPGGAYARFGSGGGIAVYRAAATIQGSVLNGNFAGDEGGAIYSYNSSLSLSTSTMGSNDASGGGALSVWYGEATITGGDISYNSAANWGGGVYASYSQIRIDGVPMIGNQTQGEGGAAYFWNSAATLTNSTLDGNDAAAEGGGIGGYYRTRLVLAGGSISGNQSGGEGGGMYLGGYSLLAINGAAITGNNAAGRGGGIYSYYNQEIITNSTISNNAAGSTGGGIYSGYALGQITGNVITGNSAGTYRGGGGLYLYAPKSVVSANIIAYNSAYYGGGAVVYSDCADCFNQNSTFATVSNNSIVGNVASGATGGGGLFAEYNSWVAITNNTVVGNQAQAGRGGGVWVDDNEVLYLVNNIVQGNSATTGAGVYYRSSNGIAPPLITNNDIAGNTPDNWATGAYNGVPDPTGMSGNVSSDPLLSLTAEGVYTLLPGSPAIDAGTLAVPGITGPDAAGGPRVQASFAGGAAQVDLGAVEFPYPGTNTPPVAVAVSRAGFRKNGTVVLDGTRSFDPDGDPLTFLWSQVAGPPVTLSSGSGAFVTLLGVGTSRTPAAGPFDFSFSLPTSVVLDLTVSDGKSSDTTRLEVRMLGDAAAIDLDTAGYVFDQESGIPNEKGGIAFAADGSEYFVVADADLFSSVVLRGAVLRDPVTARITGLGAAHRLAAVPIASGLARHPSGTLFVLSKFSGGTSSQELVEIRPDGTSAAFDLSALGMAAPLGLAFVPPGPANAGRLLVGDEVTFQIREVQLADNGDGTFTPTAATLFADFANGADVSPIAMTFLGPSGGPFDLLVVGPQRTTFQSGSTIHRIVLDPTTGQPVGGPISPPAFAAYSQMTSLGLFWPYGAARDPLTGQIVVSNAYGDYPFASTLFFDALPLDLDRDDLPDDSDNCPSTPNPAQSDSNDNGVGDACDNVGNANARPVANAGPDQAVNELTLVTLDGSASSDPDAGTTLTYAWTQTGGPAVTLTGAGTVSPTFTAPAVAPAGATLTFSLQVSDGIGLSSADTVRIVIANLNTPPTIVIQVLPTTFVTAGTVVTLDASSTADPDLDPVRFLWIQTSGPAVTLGNATTAVATFTAPNVPLTTPLRFRVTADDGLEASAAFVDVTVTPFGADLSISKTHSGSVLPGGFVTFTLRVGNTGPQDEPGPVQVVDTLPAGLTLSDSTGAGWSCSDSGQTVSCTHAGPLPASICPLYGTDGSGGNLYVIDPATGAATSVGALGINAPALAIDSTTGTLYAGGGAGATSLYTVDPLTAATVLVGGSGMTGATLSSFDFDLGGTLFASVNLFDPANTGGDILATIDKPTGIATIRGPFGNGIGGFRLAPGIEAIAFSPAGILYGASAPQYLTVGDPTLYTIDPATGLATPIVPIEDAAGVPIPDGIVSLEFDANGVLYGGTGGSPGNLVRINPTTGVYTLIGHTVDSSLAALALPPCLPGTPLPDLGLIAVAAPSASGTLANTATVAGVLPDPNPTNNIIVDLVDVGGPGLPPVADAGRDTRATQLTGSVMLDGSASFDPEGQPLKFGWVQISGTSVSVVNGDTATPTVDVSAISSSEILIFRLVVNDLGNIGNLSIDDVAVQVVPVPDWHQFRHDEAHTGRMTAFGPTSGGSAFSMTFPAGIRSSVSFDYIDGMYVGADDGKLYALNLDGTIRWTFATGGPVRTTPLVAADGSVYFGSFDGSFYALDASGAERWRAAASAGGLFRFSSPILDPATGFIVVGASDGVLRALSTATGGLVWSLTAGGPIYASPVAVGGRVLFGSNDGRVCALDSATGAVVYISNVGSPVQSSPAIDASGGRFFVGADDGSVRAFDLASGAQVWSTATGGTVTSSPALDLSRGRIYVGSDDHSLYALDAATGAVAWQQPTGEAVRSSPTVDAAGNVYVGSCDGNVYGFDASGTLLFTFFSSGLIIPSPTLGTDGLLYIGSDDRYLYAIGPDPFGGLPLRAARVDQVQPPGAIQGQTIEVAVLGADLGAGIDLGFGAGVKVLARHSVSAREMRATLQIEPGAALGARDVVVSNHEGLPSTQVRGFEVGFDCRRADISQDGSVDGIDLALLAGRFGARSESGGTSDLDGSGDVDGVDLSLLATRFGSSGECR